MNCNYRKTLLFILPVSCLLACSEGRRDKVISSTKPATDMAVVHDTVYVTNADNDWQRNFGLTHNPQIDSIWFKPVSFYIDNPKCSPIAIDFYQGQFRPSDNHTTEALLKLVTTDDQNLRPFYRWCLSKTIQVEDGALGEYTGVPARRYAEKFPQEFFSYIDYDTTKGKYRDWVSAIAYSGFYDEDDYREPALIRQRMARLMKQNCKKCSAEMLHRIDQMAQACFEEADPH